MNCDIIVILFRFTKISRIYFLTEVFSMIQPNKVTILNNFRVRNYTQERLNQDELKCLIQFLASLEICDECSSRIMQLKSSFGSDLDFSIDLSLKTLDIHYNRQQISSW